MGIDQRHVGLCAHLQHAGIDAQQPRRRAGDQIERAGQIDPAIAHKCQCQRQQRFGAGHARFGVGKRQALVFGSARVVARGDHIDRAVGNRIDHRTTIGVLSQRRGHPAECAEIAQFQIRQHEMRRGHARRHTNALGLGRAHQIERARGRHLAEMDMRAGHPGQCDIATHRQRFGLCRGAGQAQPGGHFARRRHRMANQPGIFGVGHHHQSEHGAIGQEPPHHARIRDPVPPGRHGPRPGIAHQRQFGQFDTLQRARGSGKRVNPHIGLAGQGGKPHARRVIERRPLIGHQRRTGDPAKMERRLVHGKHAQIDQTGGDQLPTGIDHSVTRFGRDVAQCGNTPCSQSNSAGHGRAARQDQSAVGDGYGIGDHAAPPARVSQPGRPRARRVSTSRQAMRIATPLSTCCVIRLRVG